MFPTFSAKVVLVALSIILGVPLLYVVYDLGRRSAEAEHAERSLVATQEGARQTTEAARRLRRELELARERARSAAERARQRVETQGQRDACAEVLAVINELRRQASR